MIKSSWKLKRLSCSVGSPDSTRRKVLSPCSSPKKATFPPHPVATVFVKELGRKEVNKVNQHGDTALHRLPSFCMAAALVNHGANFFATNRHGMTPLHVAARSGRLDLCILLLNALRLRSHRTKARYLAMRDNDGKCALDYAPLVPLPPPESEHSPSPVSGVEKREGEVLSLLLQHCPAAYRTGHLTELLAAALESGNFTAAERLQQVLKGREDAKLPYLLLSFGESLSSQDTGRLEGLLAAASKAGNLAVVEVLLVELNGREDHTLQSLVDCAALLGAVEGNHSGVLMALLEHTSAPPPTCTTASDHMQAKKKVQQVQRELYCGGIIKPCLSKALMLDHAACADVLLVHSDRIAPPVEARDDPADYFRTRLHGFRCVREGRTDLVLAILRHLERLQDMSILRTQLHAVFDIYLEVIQHAATHGRLALMRGVFLSKEWCFWHGDEVRNALFRHTDESDPGFLITREFTSIYAAQLTVIFADECPICKEDLKPSSKIAACPLCKNICCAKCSAIDAHCTLNAANKDEKQALNLFDNPDHRKIRCWACRNEHELRNDNFLWGDMLEVEQDGVVEGVEAMEVQEEEEENAGEVQEETEVVWEGISQLIDAARRGKSPGFVARFGREAA